MGNVSEFHLPANAESLESVAYLLMRFVIYAENPNPNAQQKEWKKDEILALYHECYKTVKGTKPGVTSDS